MGWVVIVISVNKKSDVMLDKSHWWRQ